MSNSQERGLKAYLPPLQSRLVRNLAKLQGRSMSSIVAESVKRDFDKMTPRERERILKSK